MNKLFILIVLGLILCNFTAAQSLRAELEKVKEIKLLESNRDDVRKIFKHFKLKKQDDFQYYEYFSTKNAEIEVLYSSGKCSENSQDFDVSVWKVIVVHIITKIRIKFEEIGLDFSKFQKGFGRGNYYLYNNDLGLVVKLPADKIEEIYFIPTKQYFPSLCDKKTTNGFSSIISLFNNFQREKKYHLFPPIAKVNKLNLDKIEIKANCQSYDVKQSKTCSNSSKIVKVFTEDDNPYQDELIYNYTVTGGKIIGTGAKVLWDLSGVKAGEYKITAAVDDGCGYCGKTMTKTVTVKECPNCKEK